MRYNSTVHVGVFWKGPDLHLGTYRLLWHARLVAWLYLRLWPYRAVTITRCTSDEPIIFSGPCFADEALVGTLEQIADSLPPSAVHRKPMSTTTPTPEDIALRNRLEAGISSDCCLARDAAQLIADHCAPLRERIRSLETTVSASVSATSTVLQYESTGTVSDENQRIAELSEIGRLAVEARRLYNSTVDASEEWFAMECALAKAADAYLAKEPKP